jgi:hypothetical protein
MRPHPVAQTIVRMTSTTLLRLSLELRPGTSPLCGRIVDESGGVHEFVGWTGLASALEEVLEAHPYVPKEDVS